MFVWRSDEMCKSVLKSSHQGPNANVHTSRHCGTLAFTQISPSINNNQDVAFSNFPDFKRLKSEQKRILSYHFGQEGCSWH